MRSSLANPLQPPRYKRGQIVMVDFGPNPSNITAPGVMVGPLSVFPEMYKDRQCIVLSSQFGTTTIVPLSTKAPPKFKDFHYKITAGSYSCMSATQDSWVKGNMITTVSNKRIDRPYVSGRFASIFLSAADLKEVHKAVICGLLLGHVAQHI